MGYGYCSLGDQNLEGQLMTQRFRILSELQKLCFCHVPGVGVGGGDAKSISFSLMLLLPEDCQTSEV